jgi:2-polyprenyl-6-methoxyphenol hydroxylase-like FAD-dependent oxidoreductase
MSIAVVGAGIAGLATAVGLQRVGHDCVVYEEAPELRLSGAAVTLWPNGAGALVQLGGPVEGLGRHAQHTCPGHHDVVHQAFSSRAYSAVHVGTGVPPTRREHCAAHQAFVSDRCARSSSGGYRSRARTAAMRAESVRQAHGCR